MQEHEFWSSLNKNRPEYYMSAVFSHGTIILFLLFFTDLILFFEKRFEEMLKSSKLEVVTIFVKTFFGSNIFRNNFAYQWQIFWNIFCLL